jgi:LmeA-like phospholipid-binding
MVRAAFALLGLLVAALVGSQLALPRVAERRISSDLSKSGEVRRVSVEAVPALKLLFKRADRVEIDMAEVRAGSTGRLAQLLRRTRATDELDARVDLVLLGPLRLHAVALRKDAERLSGEATLSEQELAAALPTQLRLRPVEDPAGELVLEGAVGPLSARARLTAQDGALVVAPEGLLGGLGSLTVFRDSRIQVMDVGSRVGPDGFTLTAAGRVAG